MELILWVAQGPVVPPFMYDRTNRMLLHSSRNLECLILRQREHSALKWSRSSLSRFMTPDQVTDHVTGQVTFHRPFRCLFMFVYVCLLMFGHLTFSGNCI